MGIDRSGRILSLVQSKSIRFIGFAFLAATLAQGQTDWPAAGRDSNETKYSPLAQISTKNVSKLRRAWTYRIGDKHGLFAATPLMIDGGLYFTTTNVVHAIEATTSKLLWKYEAPTITRRGVTYWPGDAQNSPRLIVGAGTTWRPLSEASAILERMNRRQTDLTHAT